MESRYQRKLYPIVGSTSEQAREAADELAASGDYDLIFCGFARNSGIHEGCSALHRQYGLCPDSHHSRSYHHAEHARFFSTTVLDYVKNTKDAAQGYSLFFWNKLKKRTNVEILKSYSEVMRELHLTVLDTKLPDLCRYEKEITHAKRDFFRCTLLPPPPKQLEGSGLKELAEELMVKLKLEHA